MEKILFGTYTNQDSKGIYQAFLDEESKTISPAELIYQIGSPTYLAVDQNHRFIFAVDRRDGQGGISVIDFQTNQLLDTYLSQGSSPAYLAFDNQRNLLYSANYHKGLIEIFKVNEDGKLTLTDSFLNQGSGPRDEQQSSHMHYANLTPDNKLVTVDLGTDQVIIFDISDDGKLTKYFEYQTEPGFGPRHIRFSPNGKKAYLLGELGSLLSVLNYQDGQLDLIKTLPTIPADWTEHNGAAALRVTKDNKYIYASNRGHNSIAIFSTEDDLTFVDWTMTQGDFPRDFNLSKDEKFLIVANQKTNNASLFERNQDTGKLDLIFDDYQIPESVAVKVIK